MSNGLKETMETEKCIKYSEQEKHERKYFLAILATLMVGVAMGILGDYRGRQLNANQLKALHNHEIIITENERLIKIHAAAETTIQQFLTQEKELVRYHTEYVKDNKETHRLLIEILEILRKASRDHMLQPEVRQ